MSMKRTPLKDLPLSDIKIGDILVWEHVSSSIHYLVTHIDQSDFHVIDMSKGDLRLFLSFGVARNSSYMFKVQ